MSTRPVLNFKNYIIVTVVILFIFIAIIINQQLSKRSIENHQNQPTISKQNSLKEKIIYTLPDGWKELTDKTANTTILAVSPDYVNNGGFGKDKGIELTISNYKSTNPAKELDEIVNPPSGAYGTIIPSTILETEIDGRKTVVFKSSQEGLTLAYLIEASDLIWRISFYTNEIRDLNPDQQHIKNFISSIKFTK